MEDIICLSNVSKKYANGFKALDDVSLNVKKGEIFALLGPNGAGKTTLISIICGIVNASNGNVKISSYDNVESYKQARELIGLVPQELTTDAFETVWKVVNFSRGLFGKAPDPLYLENLLKRLSLWEKKDTQIRRLSGGMKRRVLIAKALSHEPKILFLDEPSAGVDVELRKSMWKQVRELRESGVTIILTTHYIEEAEEMADRIGVIDKGKLILIEDKKTLMDKLGKKELVMHLKKPIAKIPKDLSKFNLNLDGDKLVFTYDPNKTNNDVVELLDHLKENNIRCVDLDTRVSSLEDIFVQLIGEK